MVFDQKPTLQREQVAGSSRICKKKKKCWQSESVDILEIMTYNISIEKAVRLHQFKRELKKAVRLYQLKNKTRT